MSATTITQAANDLDLQNRVIALAHKEVLANATLAGSVYGKQLLAGSRDPGPLMYPVAVDSEAAYESALAAGRGAPGHDADVITDGAITAAIVAHWPADPV